MTVSDQRPADSPDLIHVPGGLLATVAILDAPAPSFAT